MQVSFPVDFSKKLRTFPVFVNVQRPKPLFCKSIMLFFFFGIF